MNTSELLKKLDLYLRIALGALGAAMIVWGQCSCVNVEQAPLDSTGNWSFPTKVMLHFCRRAETQTISPLFDLLYSIAKAEIPRADFWEI